MSYDGADAMMDYWTGGFRREVACFLMPWEIVSITTDDMAGGVAFDFFTIWEKMKEHKFPNPVFMVHTHPPGCTRMSYVDRNMVQGWLKALGVGIWFLIICEGQVGYYHCSKDGIDYKGQLAETLEVDGVLCRNFLYGMSCSERSFDAHDLEEIRLYLNDKLGGCPF